MTPFALTLFATLLGGTPATGETPAAPVAAPVPVADAHRLLIVVIGAAGTPEYAREFSQWADRWQRAAQQGGVRFECIGRNCKAADGIGGSPCEKISDRERLRNRIKEAQKESYEELWVVLIGHGTFDGREAKFNLRGPDVSATELQQWLQPHRGDTVVINCASSSGPFISRLSTEGRVVVTATKSGFQHNYARFGDYLSQAIADPEADLDKDGQTSLLEAWLFASRQTQQFYELEGRLPTEHSLLDDNGDGLAARSDWFRGIRPVRKPSGEISAAGPGEPSGPTVDGFRAHQFHLVRSPDERQMPPQLRRRRDELELAVIRLRQRKADMPEDEYYQKLEALLVPLAKLYKQAGER